MNLFVFQGTFNPVHNSHVRVVKFIFEKYKFQKLLVIPAFEPPHKNYDSGMSEHRMNMVKLAFLNMKNVEVSDIEYKRGGISYTYLTICELYEKFKINDKIYFIIGTDAFKYIEKWYESEKLKKLVKFIVFQRENDFFEERYSYLRDRGYDFVIENLPFEDISSSDIREKINKRESIEGLVPQTVKEYIEKNELYKI